MDANVYQHFRVDERSFIDSVGDWIEQVQSQYAPYLTEFLDPRQCYILETLIRQNSDLRFQLYGGYEQAERKRCLIFPDYYEPVDEDFEMSLYEVHYPSKFANLSHGKILGTLVGTGIKRSYFGDIISDDERWQVFIANEVDHFVVNQVTKIGKVAVRLEEIKYTDMVLPKDSWMQERGTVTSLRLDTVISEIYNISRQRSKQLIEAGKVKVNWTENTKPDFLLELLDIVSIRGYGRIQIQDLEGKTKKDKCRVLFGVLRK
ncbi:RNA-binding protein [Enterococcus mundtii]|uniref:YlmH family RNA-binding protein n=1 Tax=Enterococcus TaxID=1350 RepID=UPI0003C56DBE|nr:RNA-binding protein [Enterococcus mundtii]QCJ55846.1 RNA-binding protein [Enterococcus mundtii]BAO06421.1 30S ribosomal protein S4e [Enterococcus mundtii QU 25]